MNWYQLFYGVFGVSAIVNKKSPHYVLSPFPLVKKTHEHPLTSDFCLQWEWTQTAFTPGSNDCAVDAVRFYRRWWKHDTRSNMLIWQLSEVRERLSSWHVCGVKHDTVWKKNTYSTGNGKGVNRPNLAGVRMFINLCIPANFGVKKRIADRHIYIYI